MIVHATPEQLAADPWNASPDNAAALLRVASRLIDSALLTAVYAVDTTGKATDTTVLEALRDAACAQAATWAALGVDPTAGAAGSGAAPVRRKSLGTGTVEYDTAASASVTVQQLRADATTTLTGEAVQILAAAGLLNGQVWAYG